MSPPAIDPLLHLVPLTRSSAEPVRSAGELADQFRDHLQRAGSAADPRPQPDKNANEVSRTDSGNQNEVADSHDDEETSTQYERAPEAQETSQPTSSSLEKETEETEQDEVTLSADAAQIEIEEPPVDETTVTAKTELVVELGTEENQQRETTEQEKQSVETSNQRGKLGSQQESAQQELDANRGVADQAELAEHSGPLPSEPDQETAAGVVRDNNRRTDPGEFKPSPEESVQVSAGATDSSVRAGGDPEQTEAVLTGNSSSDKDDEIAETKRLDSPGTLRKPLESTRPAREEPLPVEANAGGAGTLDRSELSVESDAVSTTPTVRSTTTPGASLTQPTAGNADLTIGGFRTTGDAARAPVESPAETQASTRIDRFRFVQRVTGALRSAHQNDGQIQLRLSPPELGSLRIEISVRQGLVTAQLETETAAARNALLDNLPVLRERLAEQEIRIEKFDVDVRREGTQHDHENPATEDRKQQHSSSQDTRPAPTGQIEDSLATVDGSVQGDGVLDVRI